MCAQVSLNWCLQAGAVPIVCVCVCVCVCVFDPHDPDVCAGEPQLVPAGGGGADLRVLDGLHHALLRRPPPRHVPLYYSIQITHTGLCHALLRRLDHALLRRPPPRHVLS